MGYIPFINLSLQIVGLISVWISLELSKFLYRLRVEVAETQWVVEAEEEDKFMRLLLMYLLGISKSRSEMEEQGG
jgi:hypothetical protein